MQQRDLDFCLITTLVLFLFWSVHKFITKQLHVVCKNMSCQK